MLEITEDEACAIVAYTYQSKPDGEYSPYRILNKALLDQDTEKLKTLYGFIFNLLSGLRKLKRYKDSCLYRGIDGRWLKSAQNSYKKGDVLVFTSFTSTSTEEKVALSFITKDNVKIPILYEMHGEFQGYLIQYLSDFEKEKGKQTKHYHAVK